jgi:hypothetical protein
MAYDLSDLEIAREVARREQINPADFHVVPAEPRGLAADFPGPFPRQSFAPGERAEFERVRAELDTPLQIAGVHPSMPQEHQTATAYEGLLVKELAAHTENYRLQKNPTVEKLARQGYFTDKYKEGIVAEVMAEPYIKGELRPVRKIDRSGRKITEFIGSKRAWMAPYRAPALVNEDGSILSVDGQPRRFLPTGGA